MGNCIAICKPNSNKSGSESAADEHRKVLQVVKTDGKILEFKSPITVKDFLEKISGFSVAVSQILSKPLPPSYELKLGKTYHLPCNRMWWRYGRREPARDRRERLASLSGYAGCPA
ncbi:hypothetical protein CsSME_00034868 [Camellia sinensis var. sinensis]